MRDSFYALMSGLKLIEAMIVNNLSSSCDLPIERERGDGVVRVWQEDISMVIKEIHVVPTHSSTLSLSFVLVLAFIHFVIQTIWMYLPFSSNMLRLERERERGGDSPHLFSGRATHRRHPKSTKKLSVPLTIT